VAPNQMAAGKTSSELVESKDRSILRSHKLCEIGRTRAYFDHLWPDPLAEKDSLADDAVWCEPLSDN